MDGESAPQIGYDPARRTLTIDRVTYDRSIFEFLAAAATELPRQWFRIVRRIDGAITTAPTVTQRKNIIRIELSVYARNAPEAAQLSCALSRFA